jgi:hypothetical protein
MSEGTAEQYSSDAANANVDTFECSNIGHV